MANWLSSSLGICTNMVAEMMALRYGLSLAWEQGFRHVICEVDASLVLEVVDNADVTMHPLETLICMLEL